MKSIDKMPDKNEVNAAIRTLGMKLDNVHLCHDLVGKHGTALQKQLAELEHVLPGPEAVHLIRSINERANLFRITVNALINVRPERGKSSYFLKIIIVVLLLLQSGAWVET